MLDHRRDGGGDRAGRVGCVDAGVGGEQCADLVGLRRVGLDQAGQFLA
nr:hypothetical protein [Nocardia mikamii]